MTDPRRLTSSVAFAQPGADAPDDEVDLLSVLRTLWRGKWWIALLTALALAAGGYYAFVLAVPTYTAKAVVALSAREGKVVDLESVMGGLSADQATVNTEMEVIRSRRLAGRLVRELNLTEDPEFNSALRPVEPWTLAWFKQMIFGAGRERAAQETFDATVDRLIDALRVSNLRDSYVFEIWTSTRAPEKSAGIANALAELYILDQLELKFDATEKATKWLGEQVASLKVELEEAETELKDFTASTQLVSPEALAALSVQLKDLRDRLSGTHNTAAAIRARLDAIDEAKGTDDPSVIAAIAEDDSLERVAQRVAAGTASRDVFDDRLEQVIQRTKLDLVRNERQIDVLEKSISEMEERINRQSGELVTLQQLEREVEATALIYESFLSRLKEISMQQGLQEADARVLSEAVVRSAPATPRKGLILALSMFLGMVVGSGLVLLRENSQNVFRTADDLERVSGLPVLGQTPRAPKQRRQKLLEYVIAKPTSAFSEAVRNLRTSILLSDIDNPPKVIMFTSSVPGEGKTTQSLTLAHNFALMGKTVLVVEADIRRRTFREYFDVSEDEPGLVTAVVEGRPLPDVVFREEKTGLDILLGERSQVNAADFFSSRSFAEFLASAKQAYDVVILDTPPVLAVPDARVIGHVADAIVYVVHWDKTPRSQVVAGLRSLQSAKLHVTGLALSQVNPKGMKRYGYGDSYGAYGSGYYES